MDRLRPVVAFAWVLGSVLLAAVLYAGYRAGCGIQPFVLQSVRVEGAWRVGPEEVIRASGLRTGESLLGVDVERTRRLVEALPWVREARVVRQIPSTVIVEVTEWEPSYLVRLDRLYYLAQGGRVIQAPLDQGLDYPVLTGLQWADLEGDGSLREPLLRLLELVEHDALHEELSELHADAADGFTVYTPAHGGTGIELGLGEFEAKFQSLERLRRHLERKGQAAYKVDLTDRDKIVARLTPAEAKRARP